MTKHTEGDTLPITLGRIAELIGGEMVRPKTEGVLIHSVFGVNDAHAGSITFLKDNKFLPALKDSTAAAVIVEKEIDWLSMPQILVERPFSAFIKLLELFYVRPRIYRGVMKGAYIDENVSIGEDTTIYPYASVCPNVVIGRGCIIYPFAYIGDGTIIGDGCTIYPSVTIREGITIGNNVVIHPGAVIGADGFGYEYIDGRYVKIPQVGGVIIEDGVHIGANTTIDRATTGNTVIGEGTIIDNLVQVAHNVRVGKNSAIVAQAGIAGSSTIGDSSIIAAQAGIPDHINVAPRSFIGPQAGVIEDLDTGKYLGSPAIPYRDFIKRESLLKRLPEILKRLDDLEKLLYNKA